MPDPLETSFGEVVSLIERARKRAYEAVGRELVGLYWRMGEYISRKIETAEWGEGVVDGLARHLSHRFPGRRGFTSRNLFRMKQFYEAYRLDKKVSSLMTQLPWTHHLRILTQSKQREEREFYMRMAVQERWSTRELERQFRRGLFARTVLHSPKVSPVVRRIRGDAIGNVLKDAYFVEFLDLANAHTEDDLLRGLLGRLRDFLSELGHDFCFVGSEYPVQVSLRQVRPL